MRKTELNIMKFTGLMLMSFWIVFMIGAVLINFGII